MGSSTNANRVSILAFALLTLGGATAHAQTDDRARAQQLFESALADAEKGNYAAACPKFLASQNADPKTSTLINLGNCYSANGQTASAWGAYKEAVLFAKKLGRDDWAKTAGDNAAALEAKLVKLTVIAPKSVPDGLEIKRDGAVLSPGELGVAIPVDPGEHVILARAAGYREYQQKIVVKESSQSVTLPDLEKEPENTPPPVVPPPGVEQPPPPQPFWTTPRVIGAAAGGAGVIAIGVSAVLAFSAKSTFDDAKSTCTSGSKGCAPSAPGDADSAYDRAGVATGVFIGGAVLVAAGAVFFFVVPSSSSKASVAVAPAPGGITLSGTF